MFVSDGGGYLLPGEADGAAQVGSFQVRPFEMCSFQARPPKISPSKMRLIEMCPFQVRFP